MINYLIVVLMFYFLYARVIERRSLISRIIQDSLNFFEVADYKITDHNNDRINTETELKKISNCDTYVINKGSDRVIIYLHGGAYLYNLQKPQLMMAENIATSTNSTIYIPLSPLVPNNYKYCYQSLTKVYKDICNLHLKKNIILMGDSAGGGLCLGLSSVIKENKLRKPHHLILISPWIDLELNNEEITEKLEKQDKILKKDKLQKIARIFSENEDNKLLSPLKSNLEYLAPVSIITGTYDILYPDTKLLYNKLLETDNKCNYNVYDKMLHDFIIFPLPESKNAINKITDIINNS